MDLRTFLSGSERDSLAVYRPLRDGRCLYCQERLRDPLAVDHFIPWRRYPTDLGHNFVLAVAHDRCNGRKGDRIAAEVHLRRWWERNTARTERLGIRLEEEALPHDREASRKWRRGLTGSWTRCAGRRGSSARCWSRCGGEWREILEA